MSYSNSISTDSTSPVKAPRPLTQIWSWLNQSEITSDKGDVHSYLPVYEKLLEPYRFSADNILEIGLFNGASLKMWTEYFSGKVYGVDCSETPHDGMADLRPMIKEGYNISIFDATNETEIKKRFEDVRFDVIIEDAGHDVNQQIQLYNAWKPYLAKDGAYIIEDIQDIDRDRIRFETIDPERKVEIIDLRKEKKRYDDILVVIS